jgi:aspartate carbamoyltransferase regulatory subunit
MGPNSSDKQLNKLYVEKIRKGTVIDHIKAGFGVYVLKILGLDGKDGSLITMGINVKSNSALTGKKDIVKVENIYLDEKQINQIALISPDCKVSFIDDYNVVEKFIVKVPQMIRGIIKCPNDRCITNVDREPVIPEFSVITEDPLKITCIFCERVLLRPEILEIASKQS